MSAHNAEPHASGPFHCWMARAQDNIMIIIPVIEVLVAEVRCWPSVASNLSSPISYHGGASSEPEKRERSTSQIHWFAFHAGPLVPRLVWYAFSLSLSQLHSLITLFLYRSYEDGDDSSIYTYLVIRIELYICMCRSTC